MEDWLIIIIGFLAALVSSSIGFGGAMLMAPFLFFVLPPVQAVITTALLASTTNVLILSERREKHFEKRELVRLAVGTAPGMIVGIYLLQSISASAALIVAGATILAGVLLRAFGTRLTSGLPEGAGYAVGAGSGVLATTVGLAALAPAWFLIRNISPSGTRDSLTLYYLCTGAGTLALSIIVIGTGAALPAWWALLGGVASATVGHRIGKGVFEKLSVNREHYVRVALVVLALISLVAISRGIALAL